VEFPKNQNCSVGLVTTLCKNVTTFVTTFRAKNLGKAVFVTTLRPPGGIDMPAPLQASMFDFCFATLPSDFPNGVATSNKNVATFVATLNSKTLGFTDIVATLQPPGGITCLPPCPDNKSPLLKFETKQTEAAQFRGWSPVLTGLSVEHRHPEGFYHLPFT
jgi:hypothetical protein